MLSIYYNNKLVLGGAFRVKLQGKVASSLNLWMSKLGQLLLATRKKTMKKDQKDQIQQSLLKPNLSPASTISCKFTVKMWPMCDKLYTEYQPLNHLYLISILLLVISVLCMDVDKENLQIVSGSADNKLCVSSITPEVCSYREPYLVM